MLPFGVFFCYFLSLQQSYALQLQKRDADFASVRTRLDRPYVNEESNHPDKYFHESTFHQHYDGRFAERPLKYDEKQSHLSALVQTYLSTMEDIGAETWLMHGTLLGWYWNRKNMPWDSDIDVMVTEESIYFLARYYNMTMHHFKPPGETLARNYLLEVNPHYSETKIDKENRIDARWIDTETGLFIDITTLRADTVTALGDIGPMLVKDNHHYHFDDIFPLRDTVFENISAKIPYAYPDILIEEYGHRAVSDIYHDNHQFDTEKQEWVPQKMAVISSDFDDD